MLLGSGTAKGAPPHEIVVVAYICALGSLSYHRNVFDMGAAGVSAGGVMYVVRK